MEVNKDILRWVLLIGATPVWFPFLRALWRDFNNALREEGGLIGQKPSPREIEAMRQEHRGEFDPLSSEPWVQPGDRRATRMRSPSPRTKSSGSMGGASGSNSGGRPGPGPNSPRGGFRAPRRR